MSSVAARTAMEMAQLPEAYMMLVAVAGTSAGSRPVGIPWGKKDSINFV
ncbi:MAG TPA: hypothetical protein VFT72_06555 [Opitutaceae bacterium]|nr:hypothetical protein [Opitutaceae bacterium]